MVDGTVLYVSESVFVSICPQTVPGHQPKSFVIQRLLCFVLYCI